MGWWGGCCAEGRCGAPRKRSPRSSLRAGGEGRSRVMGVCPLPRRSRAGGDSDSGAAGREPLRGAREHQAPAAGLRRRRRRRGAAAGAEYAGAERRGADTGRHRAGGWGGGGGGGRPRHLPVRVPPPPAPKAAEAAVRCLTRTPSPGCGGITRVLKRCWVITRGSVFPKDHRGWQWYCRGG